MLGFSASDADIERANGVNVNLLVGIVMIVMAALFIAWALWRPLGRELLGHVSRRTPGPRRVR